MRSVLTAGCLLALQICSVVGAAITPRAISNPRCGSTNPPSALIAEAAKQSRIEESGSDRFTFGKINVKTFVHVVTSEASEGMFTQSQVDDQVRVSEETFFEFSPRAGSQPLILTLIWAYRLLS